VGVVVTARDPTSLSTTLRRAGVVDGVVEIPPLDAKGRADILKALLHSYSPPPPPPCSSSSNTVHNGSKGTTTTTPPPPPPPPRVVLPIDVEEVVVRMEGCRPGDMEMIASRALHAAVSRHLQAGEGGQVKGGVGGDSSNGGSSRRREEEW